MESRFVTVDGLRLHVVAYGGEGPPLLLAHGTGLVAQVWGVMAPYLTPHFRVYALDRKGHGDSDKPDGPYEMEASIAEYAGVVSQLGGEGWAAVGHSSGGTSLGMAAVRHPALLRALVMVDPIIFPRRAPPAAAPGPNPMAERTRTRRDHWPSPQVMFDDLKEKRTFRTWQPEALWDYVRHGAERAEDGSVRLKCPPELEARMYGSGSAFDLIEEFTRIPVPTLIVRGERTDRLPLETAERVAASNGNIRLVNLPGLTHFPSMEDPEAVARLCIDFLTPAT